MARIGNFDVKLNYQGLFDADLADPINGWLDKTAIGLSAINLYPPGIPSASVVAAAPEVIQIVSPPGITPATGTAGNDGVAPAHVAIIVEPPGILSPSVVPPDEIAIIIEAPGVGIPSVSVVAPAEVTETPPTPPTTRAHGGLPTHWPPPLPEKPNWWADAWGKWAQENPHLASNDVSADAGNGFGKPPPPPDDTLIAAFPLDSGDDNVYVVPLRSFETVPEPHSRVLEYMRFHPRPQPLSLERAAGFDVITSSGGSKIHPIVWIAAGALATFAVMKVGAKFATLERKLDEVARLQTKRNAPRRRK
jgi:hypothetical protein